MRDYQRLETAENDPVHGTRSRASQHEVYYTQPMSFLHKAAFVGSIIVVIVLVVSFLWLLPCDWATCPAPVEHFNAISWDRTLFGLELKGTLHLVGGNLLGIFRGAIWGNTTNAEFPANAGGVIALVGKTGELAWYTRLPVVPTYLDCSILEIVDTGVKLCLVWGTNGYLNAIHPLSGVVVWKLETPDSTSWPQPTDIDMPIPVPDVDGDRVNDLAALARYSSGEHRVAFISSRTGHILSEPLLGPSCHEVYNLTFDLSSASLDYTCATREGKYSVLSLPVKGVIREKEGVTVEARVDETRSSGPPRGEHKVFVSNTGTCPNCSVSVNLTDTRDHTIWSYHTERAYVMSPVHLHFVRGRSIRGFLLKLWQWHSSDQHAPITVAESAVRVELIKERIVLITFNKSEIMHVVNASQTEIMRLCNATECQPLLSFQTRSALIVDLNGDGSQDLVSHYVTYKPSRDNPAQVTSLDGWVLQTKVRVVRLEDELPKLYEAVSNH